LPCALAVVLLSLLPLSVGDEGVVEGKERVPSPSDNDAVCVCYHEPSSQGGKRDQ